MPDPYVIDSDVLWPRDATHRFRIYARAGSDLRILAATDSLAGVGVALGQLHADEKERGGRLADLGQIGVLDAVEHDWIVLPFPRGGSGA